MNRIPPKAHLIARVLVGIMSAGIFLVLAWGVLAIPETEPGLAPLVQENLSSSGVKSAVTAVLLNFRGYDTLLEIAVLMLATIGVLSLRSDSSGIWAPLASAADPVLSGMTRLLVPLMVLTSGYLLWAGEHAPGGAFQAGAILGAAGVLLALSGYARPGWVSRVALRVGIATGFIVFLLIALLPLLGGGMLLEYPDGIEKPLMLVIESWLTFSIGVILVSLFITSATPERHERERG
jgi:multisubunit Na+/H+ antiporter MnhB subunit